MGKRVIAVAAEDRDVELIAAIEHPDHPAIGQDAGTQAGVRSLGVTLGGDLPAQVDAVIDFSLPAAADAIIAACETRRLPLVMATTGLSEVQQGALRGAAKSIPIVFAPSMSASVNLTMKLAQQVTRALADVPGGMDIEIVERHHRFKADAPSGTALRFGELISQAMNGDVETVHGREGETGTRPQNQIGYHAIRVGDDPGQHTIIFGMMGEKIELNVAASNRDGYAAGAIRAAKWLRGKSPGLYSMFDVLDLQ